MVSTEWSWLENSFPCGVSMNVAEPLPGKVFKIKTMLMDKLGDKRSKTLQGSKKKKTLQGSVQTQILGSGILPKCSTEEDSTFLSLVFLFKTSKQSCFTKFGGLQGLHGKT